ncbi:MAG: c-type cytochrome biogenesis protein CcmI, partial [Rhodobacterales bacterium]|nr:c-type cytochrome biogenesis protein CcmI [Rhodobacterales bacterium]
MAWTFWAAATAMAAAVAGLLALAMLRARAAAEPAAAYDLRVYRDQMAEIDRDLARGVIAPEDAERLRAEIGRRLLDADRALARATGGAGGTTGGRAPGR